MLHEVCKQENLTSNDILKTYNSISEQEMIKVESNKNLSHLSTQFSLFVKKLMVFVCVFAIAFSSSTSFAQNQNVSKGGPRKQLSTIFLSGLAGAVLGLSTLSFYSRPQDNLTNIAYGFGIGAVIGVVYTTYDTATQPQKYYGQFAPNANIASERVTPKLINIEYVDFEEEPVSVASRSSQSEVNQEWEKEFLRDVEYQKIQHIHIPIFNYEWTF